MPFHLVFHRVLNRSELVITAPNFCPVIRSDRFIVNMVMYAVFSFVIMNYVGVLSCTVIAVTTAVSLIRTKKAADPSDTE